MKIQQTDQYPCGENKTYPRYEFWGFAYAPNTGKPGCPKHGHRCKPEAKTDPNVLLMKHWQELGNHDHGKCDA